MKKYFTYLSVLLLTACQPTPWVNPAIDDPFIMQITLDRDNDQCKQLANQGVNFQNAVDNDGTSRADQLKTSRSSTLDVSLRQDEDIKQQQYRLQHKQWVNFRSCMKSRGWIKPD